jgi:hypothetical protein
MEGGLPSPSDRVQKEGVPPRGWGDSDSDEGEADGGGVVGGHCVGVRAPACTLPGFSLRHLDSLAFSGEAPPTPPRHHARAGAFSVSVFPTYNMGVCLIVLGEGGALRRT